MTEHFPTPRSHFPPPSASSRPSTRAYAESADENDEAAPEPLRWQKNLVLFVATVASVFLTGALLSHGSQIESFGELFRALPEGWVFAVPLMSILVVHELGHFIAARLHGVPASLPYFIPLPLVGPGTMGAVIAMRGRIRSRNALLDIGASGPLAGLVVAIPVILIGLSLSPVEPASTEGYVQEGQSLLYLLLKRIALGPIPAGHDVFLHPTALAGWFGLLVTMLNLVPWGQLDGGHVAYALFGPRQNLYARWVHLGLLVPVAYNLVKFLVPVLVGQSEMPVGLAIMNSMGWLIWFAMLGLLARFAGRSHPPTEPGELSPVRRGVAWMTLALFVLLFMPTPLATY